MKSLPKMKAPPPPRGKAPAPPKPKTTPAVVAEAGGAPMAQVGVGAEPVAAQVTVASSDGKSVNHADVVEREAGEQNAAPPPPVFAATGSAAARAAARAAPSQAGAGREKEFFAAQKAQQAAGEVEEEQKEAAKVASMDPVARAAYLQEKAVEQKHEDDKARMLKKQLGGGMYKSTSPTAAGRGRGSGRGRGRGGRGGGAGGSPRSGKSAATYSPSPPTPKTNRGGPPAGPPRPTSAHMAALGVSKRPSSMRDDSGVPLADRIAVQTGSPVGGGGAEGGGQGNSFTKKRLGEKKTTGTPATQSSLPPPPSPPSPPNPKETVPSIPTNLPPPPSALPAPPAVLPEPSHSPGKRANSEEGPPPLLPPPSLSLVTAAPAAAELGAAELGEIKVVQLSIVQAQGLAKSESFCRVYWNTVKVGKTQTIKGTRDPHFDSSKIDIKMDEGPDDEESKRLNSKSGSLFRNPSGLAPGDADYALCVEVWQRGTLNHTFLGQVTLDKDTVARWGVRLVGREETEKRREETGSTCLT